ncbi:hypothetical protein LMH73_021380 [Vibrio splendidus]|nr:hypothetical protein [Vibrio splendidus]MCC4880548.1 hypothetical protein [Vibrio splendidus]
MSYEQKNWRKNVNLLFRDLHTYIELSSMSQVREMLAFFEWLHPYKCKESLERHESHASKIMQENGVVYLHVFGANFDSSINRVTTMIVSVNSTSSRPDLVWSDFFHPLYDKKDRNDNNLPKSARLLLKTLKAQ